MDWGFGQASQTGAAVKVEWAVYLPLHMKCFVFLSPYYLSALRNFASASPSFPVLHVAAFWLQTETRRLLWVVHHQPGVWHLSLPCGKMRLEDSCKHTEDLYSEQQLQMRSLLDVMIDRTAWGEVIARGEHAALEASNMIVQEIRGFLLPWTKSCSENHLLNHASRGPFKLCLPGKNTSLVLFKFLLKTFPPLTFLCLFRQSLASLLTTS